MKTRKIHNLIEKNKKSDEIDELISKIGEENYCHVFDGKLYRDSCFKFFSALEILSKLHMEMLMPLAWALDLQLKLNKQKARSNKFRKKCGEVNKFNAKKL